MAERKIRKQGWNYVVCRSPDETRTAAELDWDQLVNQIATLASTVRVNLLMKTLLVINHFVRVLNECVGRVQDSPLPKDKKNGRKACPMLGKKQKGKKMITWLSLNMFRPANLHKLSKARDKAI